MITSQVLYHLTKGACADVAGFTTDAFTTVFFTAKPDILTYFTSFRLGLPLEIGVFFSTAGSGGVDFSTGNDIP